MEDLSPRQRRRRVAERNKEDLPPQHNDGWKHVWVWIPGHKRNPPRYEGKWDVVRSPAVKPLRKGFALWRRAKERAGLRKWLRLRHQHFVSANQHRRPARAFKRDFGVCVERAQAVTNMVRGTFAWTVATPCSWHKSGHMHMAHYPYVEDVEEFFVEQRLIPEGSHGHLPPLDPDVDRELLWSCDHQTRTASLGIWTVKELHPDPTKQSHHPSRCFVVAAHVGNENQRSMNLWMSHNRVNHLVEEYGTVPAPYNVRTKNFLCCDARAIEKLFSISGANHYWHSQSKQCCLFCPKTHQQVRDWDVDSVEQRSHGDRVTSITSFEWHQVVPDYMLHGNRNWWCRALGGAFAFLAAKECRVTLSVVLERCQEVSDLIASTGTVDISWEAARDLLSVDFRSLQLPSSHPTYPLYLSTDHGLYDEGEVVVELLSSWQELYQLLDIVRWPDDIVTHRVEDLCCLMRQCIGYMIPYGFNPTVWMHVIAFHLPYHVQTFGNLRRFALWGQEAKHQDFRRRYHTGPLKGHVALGYGMDSQRVHYKVKADHLPELEPMLRSIPPTLVDVDPEIVPGGNDCEFDDL